MHDAPSGGIDQCAIEAELQRVLNSKTFTANERARRLLWFIVTKYLANDKGALKGDVLAIEVFDKGGDFNSRLQSTIRTAAHRLRGTLQRYYDDEGSTDPIAISVPKGRYVPEFWPCEHRFALTPPAKPNRIDSHSLVGRAADMEFLDQEFRLALSGQGHLVCVVAEPGIGKTRLVESFLKKVQRDNNAHIGTGRCRLQLQSGDPYQVWLDILSSLGDSREETKELLHTAAATWWKRIYANESGEATIFRLRREMEEFFAQLAKIGPIVIFMDDLHWADIATIDLLNQILPSLRSLKVLLLAAYRQSDMMIRQNPFLAIESELEMHGLYRRLPLRELSVQAVEAYLDHEFHGHTFPSGLATDLHAASGGNALCLTDMLQYAVHRGWVCTSNQGWRFSAAPSIWRSELPESVAAMAAKKMGEVEERDQQLLWVSSLQGIVFDSGVVAKAMDLDKATVDDRLGRLRRTHQLLRPALAPSYPYAGERYEFAHVLYFDALQQINSPAQLAEFSKRTADAMISTYGNANEAAAPTVARLLEDGGEAALAVPFYLRGAQRALRLSAFHQALDLVEHAIGVIAQTIRTAAAIGFELEALTI